MKLLDSIVHLNAHAVLVCLAVYKTWKSLHPVSPLVRLNKNVIAILFFQVCDSNENATLEIKGPVCPISCFGNVDFEVILDPMDPSDLPERIVLFMLSQKN